MKNIMNQLIILISFISCLVIGLTELGVQENPSLMIWFCLILIIMFVGGLLQGVFGKD